MPTKTHTLDVQGTPASQLQFFMEMFEPAQQKLFRALRTAMRKRMPAANELVYDYFTFFVITYAATERPTDGIITIASRPDGVRLYVVLGKNLKADPKKLLKGSGTQARYVEIGSVDDISNPDIERLIDGSIEASKVPLPSAGRGRLVIRSISSKRGLGKARAVGNRVRESR